MPDDTSNPSLDVRATLDASDLQEGARTAGQSIDGLKESIGALDQGFEKATESTHNLQGEQLGSIRTSEHLALALRLMGRGGADAFAGLGVDARIFAELFAGALGPAAPVVIAISTLIGFTLPQLVKSFGGVSDATKHAGEESKKFADEQKRIRENIATEVIKQATTALGEYLNADAAFLKAYETEQGLSDKRTKDLEAQTEATKKLAIAELEHQKALELSAAGSDPGQRDVIEAKYKSLEASAKNVSERDKFQLEQDAINTEAASKANELRAANEQRQNDIDKLNEARSAAATAADHAASLGVTPDQFGSFEEAYKKTQAENADATKAYNEAQKTHRPEAEVNRLAQAVADSITKERAAFDADQSQKISEDASKKFVDSITSLSEKIEKLSAEYDSAISKRDTLITGRKAEVLDEEAGLINDDTEEGRKAAKLAAEAAAKKKHEKDAADRKAKHDAAHAESAEEKSTRQQIESAIGGITATGDKPMIAAMRKVVELFKGKTDESSQLAELAELANLHVEQMNIYKATTDAHLKQLDRAVRSNRENHKS